MENQEDQKQHSLIYRKISNTFNTTFLIINIIFFFMSAFWFVTLSTIHSRTSECNRLLTSPRILISIMILSMSLTGFFACRQKSDCLFRIYFYLLFLWIFSLLCLSVFLFVLHKETTPRLFPGTEIKEYRLEDYSGWTQRSLLKEDEWYRIKKCLINDHICNAFANQNMSVSEFYQMSLTPIQSGCCKPPLSCKFKYVKPNFWIKHPNSNIADIDCETWNNKIDTLCYECNSCRASVMANVKEYTQSTEVSISQIIAAFTVGFIAWSAWINIPKPQY